MNIRIQSLSLTNFKCFRNKVFDFESDIVTIQGRNGVGKTTIFDAVLFCLFGKNSQDQTKFNVKTTDEQGNIIPHLDHAVELTLNITSQAYPDGKTVAIRHAIREKWTKKRGSIEEVFSGDTHEYFVDGELYTAADYKKYIASLIDEQTFRILTNPSYFPSLKWQEQRTILTQMVGSIVPESVANTDELVTLCNQLKADDEDIVAYRKHLSYQIKKIKEQLEKIPVRLEEQNKALPDLLDWPALDVQYADVSRQLQDLDAKLLAIKSGGGDDVRRSEIRQQLDEKYRLLHKCEQEEQQRCLTFKKEHEDKIAERTRKFNELLNIQRDLETTVTTCDTLAQRCRETLADCEREAEDIRAKWADNESKRHIEWNDADSVCPVCGQYLPPELLQEKKQKAVERFNKEKADTKQSLIERANRVKALRADTERQLAECNQKKADSEKSLAETKENINKVFAEKQKLERDREVIPTLDFILSGHPGYQAFLKQIKSLEDELQAVPAASEADEQAVAELETQKSACTTTMAQLQQQMATKPQYDKIQSLIAAIIDEQKSLVEQLSELEKKEDIARQFEDRQNTILESRVNEHFKITRWRMFRTVVNNGDPFNEPYCECYDLNGTAYHDGLNQAARLNIGLDIINAMCHVYNVSAPVIIDQSESTLNILPTTGQQIRLKVTDTDLQIV